MIDYDKLAHEFYSVIACSSAGSDFEDIPLAVKGCIEEVKKALACSHAFVYREYPEQSPEK